MAVDHKKLTVSCLSVGLLSVVGLGIGLYIEYLNLLQCRQQVLKTHRAITAIGDLGSIIKDTETGQRGFIITGEKSYLQPFYDGQRELPAKIAAVELATQDDHMQETAIEQLVPLIKLKEDELVKTIALREKEGFDAASAVVCNHSGQHYMEDMRAILNAMMAREQTLLQQNRTLLEHKTNYILAIFTLLGIAGSSLALAVVYYMQRDLRDLKKAHALLNQHKDRLEEFYAVLGHELRTPITSIKGSLSLMASGLVGKMPEQSLAMLNISQSESDRMLRLINELLDLKKIEEGKFDLNLVTVESSKILNKTIEGLRGMASEAHVSLVEQINNDAPIKCDEDRIVQVLTNLISNAIKFSFPESTVQIVVDKNADAVRFSVKDQGPGIPENQKSKLFQKFQQIEGAKSSFKGTGLGLTIAKSIAEVHGGSIGFESEIGKGSTFWLSLPAAANS